MEVIGLASLRCGDPATIRAIAAGGGPRLKGDHLHVWCPLCDCSMSDDALEPNRISEACADQGCLCHQEEGENQ